MSDDEDCNMSQSSADESEGVPGIIAQLIDIREPLSILRKTLERRLKRKSLKDYTFWLQDTHKLPPESSLVDRCIQGEGLVQINIEIKPGVKKINIIDVLKPNDEILEDSQEEVDVVDAEPLPPPPENVTRWVVCSSFRKDQIDKKIPMDPTMWNLAHVEYWAKWAQKEFTRSDMSLKDWVMTGKELCSISHSQFKTRVSYDPSDLLWTHLELLRKCKFVAVVQKDSPEPLEPKPDLSLKEKIPSTSVPVRKTNKKAPVKLGTAKFTVMTETSPGNRTGNNGQIQLWQFLLELLTEKEHREVIHWIGDEGEFKLNNPEMVAHLWGNKKNKPNMNYEKLSRALRYYYDGDMISKVHNKRFVYKFVCNLKQLIGYTAAEINGLVLEAERKASGQIQIYS